MASATGPLRGFKVAKISGGGEGMVLAVGVLRREGCHHVRGSAEYEAWESLQEVNSVSSIYCRLEKGRKDGESCIGATKLLSHSEVFHKPDIAPGDWSHNI